MRHESCVVIFSSKVKVCLMRSWTGTGLLALIATLAGAASAEAAAIPVSTLFKDFTVITDQISSSLALMSKVRSWCGPRIATPVGSEQFDAQPRSPIW